MHRSHCALAALALLTTAAAARAQATRAAARLRFRGSAEQYRATRAALLLTSRT